jgi:hypothetical protein
MDCGTAAEILVRRIYREATPDEERDLFSHLTVCQACREMDQDYWTIARILDREQPETPFASASGGRLNWRSRWGRYVPALVAACLLVGVIAVGGVSVQLGSWGFRFGGGPALDRNEVERLVRTELERAESPTMTASLDQLGRVVSRQNEILVFLLGTQQRNQVLTVRTFDELERQIRAIWTQGGPLMSTAFPADLRMGPESGDWRGENNLPIGGVDQ